LSILYKELLAHMLSDTHSLTKIIADIGVDNIPFKKGRNLYRMIEETFKKYRTIPTKAVLADRFSHYWDDSYDVFYDELKKIPTQVEELRWTIDRVKEDYNKVCVNRLVEDLKTTDIESKNIDIKKLNLKLREHVSEVDKIYKVSSYKEGTLKSSATNFKKKYLERKADPTLAQGMHLGYAEFDRITNGLREGELLLIGGESGHGKSTLAMNMGINAWLGKNRMTDDEFELPGAHIIFFSIEMPYDTLEMRFYASLAGVGLYGIRDGTLNSEDQGKLFAAVDFVERYPYDFDIKDVPRGATLRDIELKYLEKCREVTDYETSRKIVIVDYISLLSLDYVENSDWLNLGKLAEGLHELCREYHFPAISPVQLNRAKPGAAAGIDRVGRSAMIPQNANIILNIEAREEEELRTDMVVRIAKMRDGEKGVFTLQKMLHMMRLIDADPDWTPEDYDGDDSDVDKEFKGV